MSAPFIGDADGCVDAVMFDGLAVSVAIERAFDVLPVEGIELEESPPLPSPSDD